MILPTRRLAALAVVVAVAAATFPGRVTAPMWLVLLVVNALLLLVALLDGVATVRRTSLVVTRRHPATVEKGRTARLGWRVENRSDRTVRVELADGLVESLRASADGFSAKLGPRQSAEAHTSISPVRRGLFPMATVRLRVTGPLGLAVRHYRVAAYSELRVLPVFRSRQDAELFVNRAKVLESGLRTARGLGSGTEFETLREFGINDDFRRIDWRASARAGKPIVRAYRAERNQNVVMLLDNGRTMAGRVDGFPRVEHVMDAALMLGSVTTRLGDRCGLVCFDTEVRSVIPPSRIPSQVSRFVEAMFDLEPVLAESDYAGAFAEVVARFRRRALLVIFTDLVEQAVLESLLPALPVILKTHVVVVAAVSDPLLSEWATGASDTTEDAYRQVAAAAALEERRRTSNRLTAAGVHVVDAPADKLPGAVATAYLRLKARGGL